MATPMSSYRVPIATEFPWPRSRHAATLRCSHSTVTQLIETGTLGERSGPRLEETIRPVTNFRARLGTAFKAKADKISRRKKALNRKGRVKSPQGSTASALVQTAAEGMRSGQLFIGWERHPHRIFTADYPNAAHPQLVPSNLAGFACRTAARATFMAIAILKSFDRGHGLAVLKLNDSQSELVVRVTGSDRTVMSSVVPGQRIRFDVRRDRRGGTLAVDVRPAGSIAG